MCAQLSCVPPRAFGKCRTGSVILIVTSSSHLSLSASKYYSVLMSNIVYLHENVFFLLLFTVLQVIVKVSDEIVNLVSK